MTKETIEEAAERITHNDTLSWENNLAKESFIQGVNWHIEKIGLMEIELNYTKRLLANCEKALEDRDNKYLTFKPQEQ
jgi:hypothetical protein